MAHSSSDTAILTMEKSFNYRGVREHWQNAYHLDSVPATEATWAALATAAWALEAPVLPPSVQWEVAYGHVPGTPPVLVYELDAAPAGEGGQPGTWPDGGIRVAAPGDAAMWVRWGTTQRSSLGKPIYLRNYFHGVHLAADADAPADTQVTALNTLGAAWVSGVSAAGQVFHRAGPRGAVAQNHRVGQWITTRTLKHRGKRHSFDRNANPAGYSWKLIPSELTIN